jgi:hypothetical protein
MWFFIECNFINTSCVLFGGSSSWFFIVIHWFTCSLFIHLLFIHYSSFILVLGWDMGMNCKNESIVLLVVVIIDVL